MAMPVIGQPRLQLEPLAGETDVHRLRVGPAVGDIAEGIVDHVPGPALILRGHARGTAQMIAVHEIERRRSGVHIVHHGDGKIVQPDIFAQRLSGGVGLGDDVIVDVGDIERRGRRPTPQLCPSLRGIGLHRCDRTTDFVGFIA